MILEMTLLFMGSAPVLDAQSKRIRRFDGRAAVYACKTRANDKIILIAPMKGEYSYLYIIYTDVLDLSVIKTRLGNIIDMETNGGVYSQHLISKYYHAIKKTPKRMLKYNGIKVDKVLYGSCDV